MNAKNGKLHSEAVNSPIVSVLLSLVAEEECALNELTAAVGAGDDDLALRIAKRLAASRAAHPVIAPRR